jgi:iron complex transport system ATP-binding protein
VTALFARSLTVRRHGKLILDNVSFSAQGGEFVAVIGPNGAGKSTMLAALAGLHSQSTGEVAVDGVSLKALRGAALARQRAYLPQNPRCEWPISVERLVALGLTPVLPALGGLPASFRPQIEAALISSDLLEKRSQTATTLSGGELARAMLARALVGDPAILIVDEPTAGLDPRHALEAVARLRACAGAGKLVIAAIHDLTLVARYATRVLALKAARVVADGPVLDTLTPELLQTLFDVEAWVAHTPHGALVDYAEVEHADVETRRSPGEA